jgi:hypothetical protein
MGHPLNSHELGLAGMADPFLRQGELKVRPVTRSQARFRDKIWAWGEFGAARNLRRMPSRETKADFESFWRGKEGGDSCPCCTTKVAWSELISVLGVDEILKNITRRQNR